AVATATGALDNNDPHRVLNGPIPPFVLDTTYCSFPVLVEVTANKEYSKIATLPDGTLLSAMTTGKLRLQLTNGDTGTTRDLKVSGPGTFPYDPEAGSFTITSRGRAFNFNPAADASRFGQPALALDTGAVVMAFGPSVMTTYAVSGHVTDLCAA